MIKKIFIDNFRCFSNFELHLDELTLLIGSNGSGKSSVLDVIYATRRLLSGSAKLTDPDIFPYETLTRWQNRKIQIFEFEVLIENTLFNYRLEVEHEEKNRKARVKSETLSAQGYPLFEFKRGDVQLFRDNSSKGPKFSAEWSESALARVPSRDDNIQLTRFLEYMRNVFVCGLYPMGFLAESKTEDSILYRDGSNFSSWYRHVVQERQELVPEFNNSIKDLINGFVSIRLERIGLETRVFILIFEHEGQRYELNLSEISDGQRALLALYALINLTLGQGNTIFFDEPDNYISLKEIQPWLTTLSDACGSLVPQAVICSHHPEIIDYLSVDNAILLKIEESGLITPKRVELINVDGGLKFSEIVARGWEL